MQALGIPDRHGVPTNTDNRAIWRTFARHWYLFRATPSRLWFEHALETIFGVAERLTEANADAIYDRIADALPTPEMRPRALYDRFDIEAISTTDGALDSLEFHDEIIQSGWKGRVLPAYRPDWVIDPDRDRAGFTARVEQLVTLAGTTMSWAGYLEAHRVRRAYFKARGATSTDHGHPSAHTENLGTDDAEALFERILGGTYADADAESLPRPDADRDGAHEPRRWAGDAIHPGVRGATTTAISLRLSAWTRAPISRRRPNTCVR